MLNVFRLKNKLLRFTHEDDSVMETEIQIKIRICKIFDKFLDKRQDFLMTNTIVWFNKLLHKKNEELEKAVVDELKMILPNIAMTSIEEVDSDKNNEEDVGGVAAIGNLTNLLGNKKKDLKFTNFVQEILGPNEYLQIYDLDTYLSLHAAADGDDKTTVTGIF